MKIEEFLKENKNKITSILVTTEYASFLLREKDRIKNIEDIKLRHFKEPKEESNLLIYHNENCLYITIPKKMLDKDLYEYKHTDDFIDGQIEKVYRIDTEELKLTFTINSLLK